MENKLKTEEKDESSDAYILKTLESYLNFYRYRIVSRFVKKAHILLDVGTGCGYGVHFLDEKFHSDLSVGIDACDKALKHANKRYKGQRRCFIRCSATHLPFKNKSFDLITCLEVIEHINTPSTTLNEIRRTLKHDGSLVISTPNSYTIGSLLRKKDKNNPPKNPHHIREYSVPEFKELLRKEKFIVIHKMGVYTTVPQVEKIKRIRNSYVYSRLSCHAFSFLQWLCRYQLYVCKSMPGRTHGQSNELGAAAQSLRHDLNLRFIRVWMGG